MKEFKAKNLAHTTVAAFASAMLAVTGCSSSSDTAPITPPTDKATQDQISAVPYEGGIRYIGDKGTNLCFAATRQVHGFSITAVPCTKEVLDNIRQADRPNVAPAINSPYIAPGN